MIFAFDKPHEVGTICHGSKCPICGNEVVTNGFIDGETLPDDQPFYIVRKATREEFAAQIAKYPGTQWIAPTDYFYEVTTD